MRLKFSTIFTVLFLAGSSYGRPQKIEVSSDLQSKIEDRDTEGWRPVHLGEYVTQDSNPVGKDLPIIVEGNSRYKDEDRKSVVRNNLFYEDHTAAHGDQKNSDKNLEQLDSEVFQLDLLNRSDTLKDSKKPDFLLRDRSRNSTRKGKIEGTWVTVIDPKNNETLNRRANSTIDHSDSSSSKDGEKLSDAHRSGDPVILSRNKSSSRYSSLKKSRLDFLEILSNVESYSSSNPNASYSGNKSRTGTVNITEVRSQITLDSRAVSDSEKPVSIKEGKVRNFVRILPGYEAPKNSADKATFLQGNNRNQVLRTVPKNAETVAKNPERKSNKTVAAIHSHVNQTNTQKFRSKNSKKKLIKINQLSPQLITKNKNQGAGEKEDGKNRIKTNSSQNILGLNLKNWPNGNLQNIEDLFNYEKYTSFHDEGENLEAQEINSGGNLTNDHEVTKKPSIFLFEQSLSPVHESESQNNSQQNAQEVMQWSQIPPFTPENVGPLVAEVNGSDSDPFDLIPEGVEFDRPLNPGVNHTQSSNYHGNVDNEVEHEQPIFENPNLEATESNFDPADLTRPISEANENEQTYGYYQNGPVYSPELSKPSYFNPTSVVSQNTVVHILNTGKKRPNVTVTEMKVPSSEDSSTNEKNSSVSTPNVHIMFTTQDSDKVEENGQQLIPEVTYDDNVDCPTVMVNSYTKINNTIQSKEGCTDLSIIINSHILNTNSVFEPGATSAGNYGSENQIPSERYPGNVQGQPSYVTSDGSYGAYPTGTGQNTGGLLPSDFQDSPITGQNPQGILEDQQYPGTSTFEVFQQTLINIGSQNDVPETIEQDVPNSAITPGDGVAADTPSSGSLPETDAVNAPGSLEGLENPAAVVADDPVSGGGTPIDGIQAPLADAGPTDVLADAGPESVAADAPASPASGGSSGIQFPGGSNPLSGITSQLSDAVGNLGSQNDGGGIGGDDDDDDEDDDDILDFAPFSIMESVTSVLPYVTLMNPLNYGFLSIAVSPLAVATAGFLGLAAAFIPWAFPRVLDFGRSADRVTIRFRPNLEEIVQQSIHQYKNLNEWKSKRKKRKR